MEYHLLANHLIENAFALLFGAYYFRDNRFYAKAKNLLQKELAEQILDDGAHFELSPMYHKIILYRLLDCCNLVKNNEWKKDAGFLSLLTKQAGLMLGWIKTISFNNGKIPHLNDSADAIAPEIADLEKYAYRLNINKTIAELSASGYRKFESPYYECLCDVGKIGPDYQPGHAHADTFSFVMNINNRQVIIDVGCSTYEQGKIRAYERGTASHNTVVINGLNSSQIWGSHRVALRADVTILEETGNSIKASHNGYKRAGCLHVRQFIRETPNIFTVKDIIVKDVNNKTVNECYFHFSPDETFVINQNKVEGSDYVIEFYGDFSIATAFCSISSGFNKRISSQYIKVAFCDTLTTKICCRENIIYNR
jgi:uncharacterized heparinase superfamily protein